MTPLLGRASHATTGPKSLAVNERIEECSAIAVHPDHAALTIREREARALLDLVVQRLFGIATGLDALAISAEPVIAARLDSSSELIAATVDLIRAVALEPSDRRENLASVQRDLIQRASTSTTAAPPIGLGS